MKKENKKAQYAKKNAKANDDFEVIQEAVYAEEVPDYVKDVEAFREWQKIQKHPLLNEKSQYEASDGELYGLGMVKNVLIQHIQHLSTDEIQKVLALKKAWYKLIGKSNALKRKAFGIKVGRRTKVSKEEGVDTYTHPILEEKKAELIELFGKMFSNAEIHKVCVEEWKLPISFDNIARFRVAYANLISEKIKHHQEKAITDLRLGNKISRLEELMWWYEKFKDKFKKNESRMDGVEATKILELIKKECDGDIKINLSGDINIKHTVSIHLHQELLKGLPLRQMIIARVAVRMGIDPLTLVERLTNSYYAKFTGLTRDTEDAEYTDITHPTQSVYDFDFIQKNALDINLQRTKKEHERKIHIQEVSQNDETVQKKRSLLAILEQHRKEVELKNASIKVIEQKNKQ